MKLAIIFPVMNQRELAETAVGFAVKQLSGETDTELVIIDNASNPPLDPFDLREAPNGFQSKLVRLDKNIGVYPIFWEALKYTDADILAFFHSDLIVDEKNWDKRVIDSFQQNPNLWLEGVVGSNEIDQAGGRGAGTTSNFVGGSYMFSDGTGKVKTWQGSPAQAHGQQNWVMTKAAVVDGCAMIFRRMALEEIHQRENFPPHHFYDRLLSCEVREKGFGVSVLGIGCDHISGQTVNIEPAYKVMAAEWLKEQAIGLGRDPQQEFMENPDQILYREAERQWLNEYRDTKHLVPIRV